MNLDNAGVLDIEFDGEPLEGGVLRAIGWRDTAYDPERGLPSDVADEIVSDAVPKITFTLADHRWLKLAGFEIHGPIIDLQTMCWTVDETTDLDLDTVTNLYVPDERGGTVSPAGGHGSHLLGDLSAANAIAVVPADVELVEAGDHVDVLLLDREF